MRPSRTQWEEARQLWEADPQQTLDSVGKALGVSHQAVSKRIAAEKWQRIQSLHSIVERAQLQADRKVAEVAAVATSQGKSTTDLAVDVRADVLGRHRADWEQHRRLFGLDAIAADFDAGKKAKISAEMLLLRQKGGVPPARLLDLN